MRCQQVVRFLAVGLFQLGILSLAAAQLVLKQSNEFGVTPTLLSVKTSAIARDSIIETDTLYTFVNPKDSWSNEVELAYVVPTNSVVTGFSYFFKGKEVFAKIESKARAREMYDKLVRRNIDPALIEMVGKNTFQARIFPIEPGANLMVRFRMVSHFKGHRFEMPLPKSFGALESVEADIKILGPTKKAFTNLRINPTKTSAGLRFTSRLVKPEGLKKIAIEVVRSGQSSLLFSPDNSGGKSARPKFLIHLRPGAFASRPQMLRSAGVRSLFVRKLGPAEWGILGEALPGSIVRYQVGKKTFAVPLAKSRLESLSGVLRLWAALAIERAQSTSQVNRTIQLSKQYGLPSKHTSWIAIPEEERERLRQIELQEKSWDTISQARAIAEKEGFFSPKLGSLRKKMVGLGRQLKTDGGRVFDQNLAQSAFEVENSKPGLLRLSPEKYTLADVKNWERRTSRLYPSPIWREVRKDVLSNLSAQDQERAVLRSLTKENSPLAENWFKEEGDLALATRLRDRSKTLRIMAGVEKPVQNFAELFRAWVERDADKLRLCEKESIPLDPREKLLKLRLENALTIFDLSILRLFSTGTSLDWRRRDQENDYYLLQDLIQLELANGSAKSTRRASIADAIGRTYQEIKITEKDRRPDTSWSFQIKPVIDTSKLLEGVLAAPQGSEAQKKAIAYIEDRARLVGLPAEEVVFDLTLGKQEELQWEKLRFDAQIWRDESKYREVIARLDKISKITKKANLPPDQLNIVGSARDRYVVLKRDPKTTKDQLATARKELIEESEKPVPWREPHKWKGEIHVERIDLNFELMALETQAKNKKTARRILEVTHRLTELRLKMGDPLLILEAPHDSQSVIAIFPHGEIKSFEWVASKKRWEVRFDVPPSLKEGQQKVQVIVVDKNGKAKILSMGFTVDNSKPKAIATHSGLNWTVKTDVDVARIECHLSDGTMVPLVRKNSTEWTITLLPSQSIRLFTVVDKAHNVTLLEQEK